MYRLFSKLLITDNLNIFIPNIIAIVLNTSLTAYTEIILQEPTQDTLRNIYIISSITTIINILNIILLLYMFNYLKKYYSKNLANKLMGDFYIN